MGKLTKRAVDALTAPEKGEIFVWDTELRGFGLRVKGAARKVVRDLSAVFSFAGRHGFVQKNPVEKASVRKTDNRRERFPNTGGSWTSWSSL